jgi:oligoribonuclease (3'-5' exoribonuclease)
LSDRHANLRAMTPSHLLWLDLETTGTDPADGNAAILEVGAIITTWEPELPEVARASMIVRPPGSTGDHDRLWAAMPDVVRDMHTVNGLWEAATTDPDAWNLLDADTAIAGWVLQHAGGQAVALAGSGVGHLDLPFVKAWLPRLATRLLYWPLDIGGTRRMLDLAGRQDLVNLPRDVDGKPHRALADVELHVAEARGYLQMLRQIPAPAVSPAG